MNISMSYEDYAKIDAINASAIKAGRKSMLHMRAYVDGKLSKETNAMNLGTLLHAGLLEPEKRNNDIAVWKKELGARRGKIWEAFKAENANREILTEAEFNAVNDIVIPIQKNRDIVNVLSDCEKEQTLKWGDKKYGNAKARLDGLGKDFILEYKTTGNIEERAFIRTCENMGYHLQFGWYALGYKKNFGFLPRVIILAQENKQPHDCYLMDVPNSVIESAIEEAERIATHFKACCVTGTYMGVANGQRLQFERPSWATGDDDEVNMEGIEK